MGKTMSRSVIGFAATFLGSYTAGAMLLDWTTMPSQSTLDAVSAPIVVLIGIAIAAFGVARLRDAPMFVRGAAYAWLGFFLSWGLSIHPLSVLLFLVAVLATGWMAVRSLWSGSPSAREWIKRRLDA